MPGEAPASPPSHCSSLKDCDQTPRPQEREAKILPFPDPHPGSWPCVGIPGVRKERED